MSRILYISDVRSVWIASPNLSMGITSSFSPPPFGDFNATLVKTPLADRYSERIPDQICILEFNNGGSFVIIIRDTQPNRLQLHLPAQAFDIGLHLLTRSPNGNKISHSSTRRTSAALRAKSIKGFEIEGD